jgi:hypothetical protein
MGGAGGTGAGNVFRIKEVQTPPQLRITVSGINVILTWPADMTGFTLESSPTLTSPIWSPVAGQFTVTNAINGSEKFYRLRQ